MIEQENIRDSIEEFYTKLYTDPFLDRLELEEVEFDSISEDQLKWLERPFMEEEVKLALNNW